ncbi:hypothetical protein ACRE_053510 [Hapsidospora chrysogenum ATCC 11550]|uniref:Uncharacterized protein n=1 Tax=Hapsidospora chrysogenum (strain ATCC 11550 / CBS 779.69 / DSM 880 / IAM 14645 / JCM 23072 / IMI 49137) TaxID=857340 RepID=A0A086T3E1_HAPC1|nr:hypothetical protein ACRE_053510 [Hapsidospora chrysogenum ATCC 11550]
MSSSRDVARLRLGLNPLTTTSLGSYNHLNTPISAVSMSSSHFASTQQTPSSAIQPYNPQEWVASPSQSIDRPHPYAGEAQAVALPPPPYSPPRSQPPHPTRSVHDSAPSSTPPPSRIAPSSVHRPSPEPPVNQNFPPPPGAGGRGGSRERRFGLPSFGRRSRDSDQATTPEARSHIQLARQSVGPGGFYPPEPPRPSSTVSNGSQPGPPNARRAVSAGAIETPTSARSRSGSQTRLDPGMAIPPPPPGPPPSGSRSQSVQSLDRTSVPIIAPPTRRPRITSNSCLGPVPPTPADWVDGAAEQSQQTRNHSGLTIDTETAQTAENVPEPPTSSSSLNRAKAVRHDKTIIQRRTESRTRQGARGSVDERMQFGAILDIVVPDGSSSRAPPRPPKVTPQSAGGPRLDTPRTGESSGQADSRNSTPRVAIKTQGLHKLDTATPPFSPSPSNVIQREGGPSSVHPKSLPTPPPQVRSASSYNPRETSRPPSATTPISKHLIVTQSAEQFAAGTIERFQAFAASEAALTTDAERVRLFADFMVTESRIRRERYSSAIGAMGSEIFDLTRDLFRPMMAPRRTSATSQDEWTPESSEPTRSQRSSFGTNFGAEAGPSSAPGSARLPPSPNAVVQNNSALTSAFMPSLSPILSMSVSDNLGDGDSRGRPSSRWWESSSNGDPSRRIERSKRESKYMGVPKDQWIEEDGVQSSHCTSSELESGSHYPPEKTGWHDQPEDASYTPQPLRFSQTPAGSSPSPAPGSREGLDVSRLVTLPPPYPRHHPAVNNNHPELTAIRSAVRALSDLSEAGRIKEAFTIDSSKRREEFAKEATERQRALRTNLQQEINAGNLGYADAGAIETDSQAQENDKKKELEKSEYEKFQNQVIMPLNDLLTHRIDRASELYNDLSRRLFGNGQDDVDMPQEEGDDRPELLEKLTLLKWIFEARESLHRAIYDILSDRNNRFREVVVTPYRLSGNTEKLKSAEAFFDEDATKREYDFANEVLNRARDFRAVVDNAVQRGVALQLSAFWDIAPPLSRLVEKIPPNLEGFKIQIPPSELNENPSYREHPMQYLLTLLNHTERSAYQFIEAHTNLLCLLHEVKEAVVNAKARVLATQVLEADGTPVCAEEREERARAMRRSEDARLTEDLKEKVRVVQDQWNNALAEGIRQAKERIGDWLLQTGGWDETLMEGGGIAGV